MKDTITIKYDWKPTSMAHLGCQHGGAMCANIEWSEERGTVETWRVGEFDPAIYPILEKTPRRRKPPKLRKSRRLSRSVLFTVFRITNASRYNDMTNDPKNPEYNAKARDSIMDLCPFYDPNHKCGIVREHVFKDCLTELRERERLALESARRLDDLSSAGMVKILELESKLAAAHKALTVCDGAMMGKVKPSSVAFKMIRAIMYPDNAKTLP